MTSQEEFEKWWTAQTKLYSEQAKQAAWIGWQAGMEDNKDAERYRWLRSKEEAETGWFKWNRVPNHMRQIDAAIDAAINDLHRMADELEKK